MPPPLRVDDGSTAQHRDPLAGAVEAAAEGVDEGGLADARHPGDTDPARAAGVREQPDQQVLGQHPVVGPGRLDQR